MSPIRVTLALTMTSLLSTLGCSTAPDGESAAATITATDLARLTRTISGDDFAGRGPASRGETVTLDFLQAEFERIGLAPMGDANADGTRGWLQKVPVAEITADPTTAALRVPPNPAAARRGELTSLDYGDDFVAWTLHPEATVEVTAPLVFVGYGVVAPEEGWNDYKRDVRGAIVVTLVNDPPVVGQFADAAMTYYGRWTYKYEEAARHGAAGVLIIHETEAAGYGWSVVRSSWSGPQFNLPTAPEQPQPARFEGWLSQRAADGMFTAAGLSLAELSAAAASADFEPVDLGFAAAMHLDNEVRMISSNNVIGGLAGDTEAGSQEHVLWTAHWDHLGEDAQLEGDGIYNGALDNATGTAALLELAEAFVSLTPAARRSQLFIATTLEEQGLLGSAYYAAHPVVPAAHSVAAINIDGLNVFGPTSDITVVGLGNSELDSVLAEVLAAEGRTLTADPEPEKGFFYRSDHFPLAKIGIPALYTDAGVQFIDKPAGYSDRVREQYNRLHYHQPSDEFDPTWDFEGAAADVRALFRVGLELAQGSQWPQWSVGSEFRATREASRER